jgi:hypothetical protein
VISASFPVRHRAGRTCVVIPSASCLIAAVTLAWVSLSWEVYEVALEAPLELWSGSTTAGVGKIHETGLHLVLLQFDAAGPIEALKESLGGDWTAKNSMPGFSASWRATSGDALLGSGTSGKSIGGEVSAGNLWATLGSFEAPSGREIKVSVAMRYVVPSLEGRRCKVIVRMPLVRRQEIAIANFLRGALGLLVLAGAVGAVLWAYRGHSRMLDHRVAGTEPGKFVATP